MKKKFFIIFLFLLVYAINGEKIRTLSIKEEKAFSAACKLLKTGKSTFRKGYMEKAEEFFRRSIRKFPYMHESEFYISRIQYRSGLYHSALSSIKKAIKKKKAIDEFTENRRKTDRAKLMQDRRAVKEVLERVPKNVGGCQKTKYQAVRNSVESKLEAIESRLRSLENRTGYRKLEALYMFHYGNILAKLKRGSEALENYHLAIKLNPKLRDAWVNLIVVSIKEQGINRAMELVAEAEKNGIKVGDPLKNHIRKVADASSNTGQKSD